MVGGFDFEHANIGFHNVCDKSVEALSCLFLQEIKIDIGIHALQVPGDERLEYLVYVNQHLLAVIQVPLVDSFAIAVIVRI